MTQRGIALFGPPDSGKDAVTFALHRHDPRFVLLPKLKVGAGRAEGYEFVSAEHLGKLRAEGRLLIEARRYGNMYGIDRRAVEVRHAAGCVPVVHMSDVGDLRQLVDPAPGAWLRVLLWVPREVAFARSRERGDSDTGRRLAAWDDTVLDLERNADDKLFQLRIDTDRVSADAAAVTVAEGFRQMTMEPAPR
ncbi:guanylate kinase [Nonomuraea sp. NBC_01738]|uniref:guanylate kinase n=1 Tax=Nonomuraea sp. NBC_01738 TaxID=2976003 RepID=UPI002E153CF3|nr:guanylate kinase [Nonomuraea sp. NBC_01738]